MDKQDCLLVEQDGPVVVLTLNRPEHLNSFDEQLHDDFARFWFSLETDDTVRAVVITGAGRAFSAGGSLDDFQLFADDYHARVHALRRARRLVSEMLDAHVPVVAAVNGPAVGLGCTVMTLCDIVFLAEDTYVADPHVGVALVAGDGSAVTWPAYTSLLKAKQYLFTGDRIPAADALSLGLANFTVPAASVLDEAKAFATRLAGMPPQAIQETKAVLNQVLRQGMVNTLGYGLAAESQSHDMPEYAAIPEQFKARKGG